MSAHTPGLWRINGYAIEAEDADGQGLYIAHVEDEDGGGSVGIPEARANARLIASAPELLAALKELVASLDERDIRMMATTRCRQAIAAAERRQT